MVAPSLRLISVELDEPAMTTRSARAKPRILVSTFRRHVSQAVYRTLWLRTVTSAAGHAVLVIHVIRHPARRAAPSMDAHHCAAIESPMTMTRIVPSGSPYVQWVGVVTSWATWQRSV